MPTDQPYVVLTVHTDRRLRAYGSYHSESEAHSASVEIGFTDPTVTACVATRMAPPTTVAGLVLDQHPHPAPPGLLDTIDPERIARTGDPVAGLVTDPARSRFAVVGPFPGPAAYRTWLGSGAGAGPAPVAGLHHHLLALLDGPPPYPGHDSDARVVLATTADGRFAYGPFPDALHATAWAHQLGVMIDPRRTTLTLHAVAGPFDLNGDAPARTAAPVRPATAGDTQAWPQHSHVVLIHDHTDPSAMVGFFADRAGADTWSASQRPDLDDSVRLTALPVLDPPDLR